MSLGEGSTVRRLPVVDEVVVDGETVVMVGEQVMLLAPIAAALLALVDPLVWTSVDDLGARLSKEFGPPPADGSVFALVRQLTEAGLLEQGRPGGS